MTCKLLLRCDSSGRIGFGHLLRCRSLALALRSAGVETIFLTQGLPGNGAVLIEETGLTLRWLETRSNPVALPLADARQLIELAKAEQIGCVLVDHYGADDDYLALLADAGLCVAVIDDVADRDLRTVGWVLNQNLGAEPLVYQLAPDAVRLLGPSYALIRSEFAVERKLLIRRFSAHDRHVLVTLGGGDSAALAAHVIEALAGLDMSLRVRCIIGGAGPIPEELRVAAQHSPHRVKLLQAVRDMALQMAWADLSINAGGSTCWELACMGVSMLVLAFSPDQVFIAKSLAAQGLATYLGLVQDDRPPVGLAEEVSSLLANPSQRSVQARAGQALVDGHGAARVAESLIQWSKEA